MKIEIPILDFPGNGRAVIEPSKIRKPKLALPTRYVLCFFAEVIRREVRRGALKKIHTLSGECDPIPIYRHGKGADAIGVLRPGVTAPFAASCLETLIGLGGRAFIACGGAGVLDASLAPGQIFLPTSALRGEGTSYHYLKPGAWVHPHPAAVRALQVACLAHGVEPLTGATWTTDAFFRETPAIVEKRRAQGCLTVEMEAAAFFAVARFRKVPLGQLLYSGDDVSGCDWKSRGWRHKIDVREQIYRIALEACGQIKQ